jgi:Family of unknown function (DUF6334)
MDCSVRGLTLRDHEEVPLAALFTGRALRLSCGVQTDEILVEPHQSATPGLDDVSADELMAEGVGKVIESAWWMSNHRGYHDAFQMRLLDLDDRSEATRQFEAAASILWVESVTG